MYMLCLVQEDSKPGATGGIPCVQNQEIPRGFVKNYGVSPTGAQWNRSGISAGGC
jgi:hypothetical protein